jgi:nucleoside-diphosphate-sugar epimerase
VLDACRARGIQTLVYTSTPSVVHTGGDIEGGTSALPYATHFETAYPETKAIAERMVLEANGTALAQGGVLSTCALRPHLIWGPGDAHLLPRVLDRARSGRLRLVGGGAKLVDAVYVDNAADAHIAALDRLAPGAACAGRAYFVTNGEPWPQREVINGFLQAAGLPPCERSISMTAAYRVGAVLELVYRTFGITREPPMTRFVANQLGTAHWYDISDIQADLDWSPAVSMAEGMRRLREALATPN